MQSSLQWMMKDTPVLRNESWSREETGSLCYFLFHMMVVVFFCRSDKVGLSLVSLQQAHALSMTLPERGRGEGVRERIRLPHQRHQVHRWTASVWDQAKMYGEWGGKWIINLGEFRANCADRKGISMNNSLSRGPDHLPPTSTTLFFRTPHQHHLVLQDPLLICTIQWPL